MQYATLTDTIMVTVQLDSQNDQLKNNQLKKRTNNLIISKLDTNQEYSKTLESVKEKLKNYIRFRK